jgi:fucose permease
MIDLPEFLDTQPIANTTDLTERCETYAAVRKKWGFSVAGMVAFVGAEIAIVLYMIENAGKMNHPEATSTIAGSILMMIGFGFCAHTMQSTRSRLKTLLSNVCKYRSEHPTFETDNILRDHGVPLRNS